MASYTDQSTDGLLPGEPWTSAKALACFENPVAIAEGAAGAPKIATAAYGANSVNENAMKVQQFSASVTVGGGGRVFVEIPGNLVFMPTLSSGSSDLQIYLGGRDFSGKTGVYVVNTNPDDTLNGTVSWYRIVP